MSTDQQSCNLHIPETLLGYHLGACQRNSVWQRPKSWLCQFRRPQSFGNDNARCISNGVLKILELPELLLLLLCPPALTSLITFPSLPICTSKTAQDKNTHVDKCFFFLLFLVSSTKLPRNRNLVANLCLYQFRRPRSFGEG